MGGLVWLVADVEPRDGGRHVCESETTLSHIQGPVTAEDERVFAALSRLVQCCGLSVASHCAQETSIVGSDGLRIWMLWSQGMFVDREGTLVQRCRLLVLLLSLREDC